MKKPGNNITWHRQKTLAFMVFALFGIVYCLISLVNHYLLRTYALDLGMYNQAVYSYSHLRQAVFTLGIDGAEVPFLATHFSLITLLYSPLHYLFGSYTLLIIQITAILSGGLAVYKYSADRFGDDSSVPLIALIHFFSLWGIYSALAFDYHDNVVGSMMVLWFVYFLEKRRIVLSSVFLLLVLFSKEVMGFWMFFVIAGMMIKNRKRFLHQYIRFEIPAAVFCLLYGVMVTGIIMPFLQDSTTNLQLSRYAHLGGSIPEIFAGIINKPQQIIEFLFANTTGDNAYDGIKNEFHIMLLLSGGICFFLRPAYLLMILPLYALKFMSSDYALWGINYQYSIEFVPLLSMAVIDITGSLKKYQSAFLIVVTLVTAVSTFATLENRKSQWYNGQNAQFYSSAHYSTDLDVKSIFRDIRVIEPDVVVSVSSSLAPHMASRQKMYHFPVIKDAVYIALLKSRSGTYPLSYTEFTDKCIELKASPEFEVLIDSDDLLILKRK